MDINVSAAEELQKRINEPDRLLLNEGNTRIRADIHRAVEATVSRFGKLDSVLANAGIHRCNTLLDIADEELDLMIQTNIYGTVNTLREAIPPIIHAGGGTVVINASGQWFVGKPNSFAYGMTKGRLRRFQLLHRRTLSGGWRTGGTVNTMTLYLGRLTCLLLQIIVANICSSLFF